MPAGHNDGFAKLITDSITHRDVGLVLEDQDHSESYHLYRRWTKSKKSNISPEKVDELLWIIKTDPDQEMVDRAMYHLVHEFQPKIIKIAMFHLKKMRIKIRCRHVHMMDFIQWGNVGFLDAIKRWDFKSQKLYFNRYAMYRIVDSIYTAVIRDNLVPIDPNEYSYRQQVAKAIRQWGDHRSDDFISKKMKNKILTPYRVRRIRREIDQEILGLGERYHRQGNPNFTYEDVLVDPQVSPLTACLIKFAEQRDKKRLQEELKTIDRCSKYLKYVERAALYRHAQIQNNAWFMPQKDFRTQYGIEDHFAYHSLYKRAKNIFNHWKKFGDRGFKSDGSPRWAKGLSKLKNNPPRNGAS